MHSKVEDNLVQFLMVSTKSDIVQSRWTPLNQTYQVGLNVLFGIRPKKKKALPQPESCTLRIVGQLRTSQERPRESALQLTNKAFADLISRKLAFVANESNTHASNIQPSLCVYS